MYMLKKFFQSALFLVVFLTTQNTIAQVSQAPDGIQFQALATDASGRPAAGRVIHVKNAIIAKTATGAIVYAETFKVTASSAGIFSIVLGKGTYASGVSSIASIDWSNGPFFLNLKIAVEPTIPNPSWNVNNEYVDMGTSQFWSVPYAVYAGNVKGLDTKLNISDTASMLKSYFAAINLKANIESPTFTGTVKGITKSMVGLGNVDNTSDVDKPLSTATAAALETKLDKVTGIAGSSNKLAIARNINGVAFDGSGDITITAAAEQLTGTALKSTITGSNLTSVGTLNNLTVTNPIVGSITGNAVTATTAGNITATSNTTLTTLSNLTSVGTLNNLTVTNPIVGSITGNAVTATTAGNITATSNTTLTTLSNLTSVGTIANLTTGSITNSGKVIVGSSSESSPSAILEASSTSKGFLPPRMTYAQRNSIANPANGLMIFCSDCGLYGEPQYYDGNNNWRKFDVSLGSGTGTLNLVVDALFSTTNGTSGSLRGQSFTTTSNPGRLIKIVTNAIGGVSGTQLLNGIAQSYLRIRSYVNDNELTNPNALSGQILATSNTNPTILDYNYGIYYPTVEFNFPNSIVLLANTKYVIEFVVGSGVSAYVKIVGAYSGGQAYDINGINQGFARDFPFQLYLQQF